MLPLVGVGVKVIVDVVKEAVQPVNKARKYVRDYKRNLVKLQEEMTYLEDRREAIKRQVNETSDHGEEIEEDVSHWQRDTNAMKIYVRLFGQSRCSRLNIKWRYRLGKEAEKKIADVKRLAESSYKFSRISHRKPPPLELELPSDENYVSMDSRTMVFEGIVNAIKHSGVKVIGVHGLGGVGKTTLVKQIAHKMQADGTFKQVPLATVSKDLNVKEIQKKLADELNLQLDPTAAEKGRAIQLWHKFKNGDRYLVILDDIWEKVDLNAIGIPIADSCKVVLTSRNEHLLEMTMDADRTFAITELTDREAWTLFKKEAGDAIEPRKEIAEEVCRRCKGLPLAINALGAALKGQPDHAWKDALIKIERYCITEIFGINPNVWASLKLSYDMLWSPIAKSCFLLCCLFPEDAEIPIDDLMRHCVARRSLSPNPRKLDEARYTMLTAVDSLKSANLLSNGIDAYGIKENFVRIHDVIRDVGISIAREEEAFLVDHGALPTGGPSSSAISTNFKGIKGLPSGLVYPQLHTLMLYNSELSDVEVLDNFFDGMPQLTVLNFTRMRMRRYPSSLAKLTNLRMLYTNQCELEDIAILQDLESNLEVLGLRGSNIVALPDIGQLTSLRVLDLQGCYKLKVIPQGVISNLTRLEELYFPMSPYRGDFYFSFLDELKRSLSTGQLTTLHIRIQDAMLLAKEGLKFENLKRFCISLGTMSKVFPYFQGTRVLYLGDVSHECSYLRNDLIPLVEKAEILHLENFKGLKKVLHDRGFGNTFPDLKYLRVKSCDEMMHPSLLFSNLTVLIVRNCKLKYLLTPTIAKGLAHLEQLRLEDCEIMEEIVGFEGQKNDELIGELRFSKLKRLELSCLASLTCFYAKKEEHQTTTEGSSACPQPFFNEQIIFPVLEMLTICRVDNIVEIWDKQSMVVLVEQGSFCQLRGVDVKYCNKLVHLFPSEMHPLLKNLEELRVGHCKTMEATVRFEGDEGLSNRVCFNKLRRLELDCLPEHIPPLFNGKVIFPVLERLTLSSMFKITEIWDMQSIAVLEEQGSFCQLRQMQVKYCNKLIHVIPSKMHRLLKNLEHLSVDKCGTMKRLVGFEGELDEDCLGNKVCFSKLRSLKLYHAPNLEQSLFNEKVSFPALEELSIKDVPKIKKIWDMQPLPKQEKDTEFWSKLLEIYVAGCGKLLYTFPSYMLPQLRNLQKLKINDCKEMEVIISDDLKEKEGTNNDIIVFSQLKALELQSLPNLKSLSNCIETQLLFSDKDAFPMLEHIELDENLEFFLNGTSTKEASMEECGTSGKESDRGKESDLNHEELVEDLETPINKVI